MTVLLLLGFLSFITSTLAAIAGLGGGMMLIAILPGLLPPHAIIPVHGVTQFASNASRAFFALKDINVSYLKPFLIGSFAGVLCLSLVVKFVPETALLGAVGMYILLTLWSHGFAQLMAKTETFYSAGFLQSGLSLIVGATGPLTTALLLKRCDDKEEIVSTNAVFMAFSHAFKIPLFIVLGFSFSEYLAEIVILSCGAILGSWIGTRLRQYVDNELFKKWVKIALTILAINIIFTSVGSAVA